MRTIRKYDLAGITGGSNFFKSINQCLASGFDIYITCAIFMKPTTNDIHGRDRFCTEFYFGIGAPFSGKLQSI